jgi:hypothetical protein
MGYLRDGIMGWLLSGRPVDQLRLIGAPPAGGALDAGQARSWTCAPRPNGPRDTVAGAMHLPLTDLIEGKTRTRPGTRNW